MNVNLWFAKDADNNEIVSIINSNKEKVYKCPICDSDVIPKAVESKKITPHFAHIDKGKCPSESFIHFWYKHKFIEVGESFTIKSDKEMDYVCKSFDTEVRYELNSGVYVPDVVIETECGNKIVFEMANTNKKQVRDYIDRWIELDKIVVEVDIKGLVNDSKQFNALYYKGKCFNFNKRDGGYYNTIGKLKENMKSTGKYDIETVRKLDWFWDELIKYRNEEVSDKQEIFKILSMIDEKSFKIINAILYKSKCTNIMYQYLEDRLNEFKEKLMMEIKRKTDIEMDGRIKTKIEYNRSSNSYDSYIGVYYYKDDCWWLHKDFSKEGVRDIVNNIRKDEYYRILKIKEDEAKVFQELTVEKIKNNKKVKYFENELKEGYRLSIFNKRREQHKDLADNINVGFGLIYNGTVALWNDIEESINTFNIDRAIDDRLSEFNCYFRDLKKINRNTINIVKCIIDIIQEKYHHYDLTINASLFLEDIYGISINNKNVSIHLYFNNLGLLKGCRDSLVIAEFKNIDKLLSLIFCLLKDEIEKRYKFYCIDCSEEVSIAKSEIDYFLKKNLNIPKRCKSCRNKRKEGKQ